MAYTFIVSDESINTYGYRILTDGIDITQFQRNPIMLFMHQRNTWNPSGDEVIGRWENLRKEDGKLLADAVFDETNPFAKKIADKVKNGFIKMASIGAERKETSTDKKHLKAGQTRATVTKSTLNEISIVDMGGNNNALKLYNASGEEIQVEELNQKPETEDMSFKTIALALGLNADATEIEVLQEVSLLKSGKETAETKLSALEDKQKETEKKEAETLIEKAAVKLGLKNQAKQSFTESYIKLFDVDHQSAKSTIENLVGAETATPDKEKSVHLNDFMKDVGGNGSEGLSDTTFDYLQKKNPKELARLKSEEPETYTQLARDYKNGVRHNA